MMLRIVTALITSLTLASAWAVSSSQRPDELKDIFFGEVLFYAYQDSYFDAIAHLDAELSQLRALDEPALDPFYQHLGLAEFSVGDLELSYRMHRKAGRAIEAILNDTVEQRVRNEAAYRLARIHYRKQEPINALHALQLIRGEVPPPIRDDEKFLRARVYVETGKFGEAIELLREMKGNPQYRGFVEYNLGMALILSGEKQQGAQELAQFGQTHSDDEAVLALRDKANLMLAHRLLDDGFAQEAGKYFDRVRLQGPFSNRALLGAGWVQAADDQYRRALVPWSLLHERRKSNASVQESLLALPYAYSKLDVHSRAAILYGEALDIMGQEIDRLNASIKSIREGKFLEALTREDIRRDKNWLLALRDLPEAPETFYIMDLMASHDFQEFLLNYRDLSNLYDQNQFWLRSLDVFEEIIGIRRAYYEPLLPEVEQQFKKLDSRMRLRLEQRDRLDDRLKSLLISRRPDYLATVDERLALDRLDTLRAYLEEYPQYKTPELNDRIARLEGVLDWRIHTQYDKRLTEAYNHLHELDEHIDRLNQVHKSFIRTRLGAVQSYEGYEVPIRQLRTRLKTAQVRLRSIMARQGNMLETLAINELDRRRARLENYQIKARFALAESYDRANAKLNEQMGKAAAEAAANKQEPVQDAEPELEPEPPSAQPADTQVSP